MWWGFPFLFLLAFPLAIVLILIGIVRRSGTKDACHGIVITQPHEDYRTWWVVFILAVFAYLCYIGANDVKPF